MASVKGGRNQNKLSFTRYNTLSVIIHINACDRETVSGFETHRYVKKTSDSRHVARKIKSSGVSDVAARRKSRAAQHERR